MLTRLAAPGCALIGAAAAWLSQGSIALTAGNGPRVALLPLSPGAIGLSLAAGAVVYLLLRAGASRAPLWLLAVLALPWLPFAVPAAFFAWDATLRALVWMAVLWGMARSVPCRWSVFQLAPRVSAGILALAIFGAAAWQVSPSVPGGDEPHYLVITQSLLLDGDLRIENNHRRGDYQVYYAGPLRPDYLRRGRNGEIYSIHAPGISAIVAPAFLVAGYPGVVVFLVAIAALGSAFLWHITWLATRDAGATWFGWAAVTLSATTIFHTFTVYPDGVGGLLVLTGVWALLRADEERRTGATSLTPWVTHGLLLSLLPWLHTRFALLAGSLGALILLRLAQTRDAAEKAVAFLALPALGALCWVGYFIVIYGTPDPSAPYGGSQQFSLAFVPGGLAGLLFDQRFGLIANAPVLAFAPIGLVAMLSTPRTPTADAAERPSARRLALELLFVVVPYLLAVTNFAMWWGGWSAPARFAAAVLPALAIPCAAAWSAMRVPATRACALGAACVTAFISAVLVVAENGRLAYNTREGYALWLDRASRLADLGQGLPAWFRGQENAFFLDIAVWGAALIAAWLGLRAIAGRLEPRRALLATTGSLVFATAAMLAMTVVWKLHRVDGRRVSPAQLALLRRLSEEPHIIAGTVNPARRLLPERVLTMLRIESDSRSVQGGGGGRGDRPLLVLPAIPAGRYRVTWKGHGDGWIMIGIGQDQFALRTERMSSISEPMEIDLPVDVRALIVRGDEEARRSVSSVVVEPQGLATEPRLAEGYARRAVRYGAVTVFFLDDRSFPEPEGFWLGGGRRSSIVIQADGRRALARLFLRNAPVENQLRIEADGWREYVALAPGEERQLEVPLAETRGATLVMFDTTSGFRPSAVEAGSKDDRFLGVWVRIE